MEGGRKGGRYGGRDVRKDGGEERSKEEKRRGRWFCFLACGKEKIGGGEEKEAKER